MPTGQEKKASHAQAPYKYDGVEENDKPINNQQETWNLSKSTAINSLTTGIDIYTTGPAFEWNGGDRCLLHCTPYFLEGNDISSYSLCP